MPCRKQSYRDEIAAKLALARIGRKRHERRGKTELRPYRCQFCRRWHITAQEPNT